MVMVAKCYRDSLDCPKSNLLIIETFELVVLVVVCY